MDSCEPIFDAPLTYEKGWGKQLTYCVAMSSMEIVDVTPRYVLDPMMNRMRRDKFNEEWLEQVIATRREQMWDMQGPEKSYVLRKRFDQEVKELAQGPIDNGELLPRQSGSLEWRQSRAEMGADVMSMTAGYTGKTEDASTT